MGVDWEKTWEADLPIQESFLQLQKFSIATVPHSLQDYFGPAGRGRIMRLRYCTTLPALCCCSAK
jgi:hypothetical protein